MDQCENPNQAAKVVALLCGMSNFLSNGGVFFPSGSYIFSNFKCLFPVEEFIAILKYVAVR